MQSGKPQEDKPEQGTRSIIVNMTKQLYGEKTDVVCGADWIEMVHEASSTKVRSPSILSGSRHLLSC